MALSLLTQTQSGLLDFQATFEPYQLQQRKTTTTTTTAVTTAVTTPTFANKFESIDFDETLQMEFNNHYHNNNNIIGSNNNNNNNNSNNNNNNNNNNFNNNNNNLHNNNSIHFNQSLTNLSRNFYHHHHLDANYEQIINFVDSPPNSEESWPDDQSKGSPGPQIIDVQTIYSNSGTRKRRMDWDSLEISGQNGKAAIEQTADIPNKIAHSDKEKLKREKPNGRGSWIDDIGFDLNPEFNNTSYLNGESYLSFTSPISVLKQEPLTDQSKINKCLLNQQHHGSVNNKSVDKSTTLTIAVIDTAQHHNTVKDKYNNKNDLNENPCSCGSSSPQQHHHHHQQQRTIQQQTSFEKNGSATTTDSRPNSVGGGGNSAGSNNHDNSAHHNAEKCHPCNSGVLQQLNAVENNKIEHSPHINLLNNAEDYKFQYILAAATSIATKNNEDTLTYLNQGQSYEIKLKKIGDLTFYRDKILKSVIKICFHERRLQFMEREQMQQWQSSRPGERIIEVDVPLSYGLCHVLQPSSPYSLNTVEVFWDPLKEVGVYIKVNCISTEFTPKKHGGEKGVPFRLQIETYLDNNNTNNITLNQTNNTTTNAVNTRSVTPSSLTVIGSGGGGGGGSSSATAAASPNSSGGSGNGGGSGGNGGSSGSSSSGSITPTNNFNGPLIGGKQPIHAAACQIKVFKLKGADRKHKQDREKIQKRPQAEQDKFQPSYECTIMNDISLDLITSAAGSYSPEYMKIFSTSPVHIPRYDGILSFPSGSPAANTSPIAINSVTSTNSPTLKLMDANMVSPQQLTPADNEDYAGSYIQKLTNLNPESTPNEVIQWLKSHRLNAYLSTFSQFSGADIMRMSKEDFIQICGLADGIRMYNILRAKAIAPRLTIYVSMDSQTFSAIYLIFNTSKELLQKLIKLPGFYELIANNTNNNNTLENSGLYNNWSMNSKYSNSDSNIYNDVNKSFIYITGPSGVHVTITDEVLNNEIKDGSLYALEVQNGKVVMKLINKNDN